MDSANAGEGPKKGVLRNGFLFVGNQPVLDFLNTRPVVNGRATELLPDLAAVLFWFQAAGVLTRAQVVALQRKWKHSRRAQSAVENLHAFRERLRTAVSLWEKGKKIPHSTIAELNRLMSAHPLASRLRAAGNTNVLEAYADPGQPEDLLALLAHQAADLFSGVDHRKVRKCANCVLHFYDTSKKGTRRWCSMQLCGNRFKVAAYAARRREARLK